MYCTASSVCRLFCLWNSSLPVRRFVTRPISDLPRLFTSMISSSSIPGEPYRSYKDAPNYGYFRNTGFVADRLEEIVQSVNFEHWGEFRTLAEEAKRELDAVSLEQKAFLRKHLTSEGFQYDAPEAFELLTKLANRHDSSLSNVQMLVREPALTYGPGGGSHRVLHDVGLYTGSTLIPPDTAIRITKAWPNGGDLLPPRADSSSVASVYNWYFRSYLERNEERGIDNDCLLNQISELILTALHTRSGWYCLHRRFEAVFMQVESIQGSGMRWLTVRISDIYKADDTVSLLEGLFAMFQACKVADDTKLKQFGNIATRLIGCTAEMYERSFPSTGLDDEIEIESTHETVDELSVTKSEIEMLKRAESGELLLDLNPGDLGRFFLANCCGDLGCGSSGYVVRSCIDGRNFVVKRWNQYEWDIMNGVRGLEDLQYEIEIYAYLHKYHPHVLGCVVPRPVAISYERGELRKPALVLTMVGEEIERRGLHPVSLEDEKEWFVNGEQLSEADILQVKTAAEENNKELEALGIEDYDIPGFNIRVEKLKDERGNKKWHVWTIDLVDDQPGIYYDGQQRLFRLRCKNALYAFRVNDARNLEHLYWGPPVPPCDGTHEMSNFQHVKSNIYPDLQVIVERRSAYPNITVMPAP